MQFCLSNFKNSRYFWKIFRFFFQANSRGIKILLRDFATFFGSCLAKFEADPVVAYT